MPPWDGSEGVDVLAATHRSGECQASTSQGAQVCPYGDPDFMDGV